jgi:hypothetical protein
MANSIWQATAQTETGNIIAGAQVTVVDEDTGVNATIYSSIGGAALTNPFFANAEGFIQFYAGAGTYRVTAEDTGTGQSITWRYIRFGDAASKDTGTAAGNVPLNSDLGNASTKTTGTASTNVPLNSDLGDASLKTVGILTGQLPTADNINMVGATENFTSNNLNPNVFGGVGASHKIANGVPFSASVADFDLNVMSTTALSSISLVSTFTIRKTFGSATVASGVTPTFLRTGNRIVIIRFSGLSGLGENDSLELLTQTSTSKITVG